MPISRPTAEIAKKYGLELKTVYNWFPDASEIAQRNKRTKTVKDWKLINVANWFIEHHEITANVLAHALNCRSANEFRYKMKNPHLLTVADIMTLSRVTRLSPDDVRELREEGDNDG